MGGSIGQATSCALLIQLLLSFQIVTAVSPIVFPPSEYWEGDDGTWSTFGVRLGTPEQVVRVLPSTQGYNTVAVLPAGCTSTNDYTACVTARGSIFNPSSSTTWQIEGNYSAGMQTNLIGDTVGLEYGIDKVGLGISAAVTNVSFTGQVVAGIIVDEFYLGTFGLGTQPTNFSVLTDSHTSFFTSLWEKNMIPSYTWAYTAGAEYRLNKIYGSLTFGGYDSSLIASSGLGISIPMAADVSRDLVVGVQSITSSTATGSKLLLPTAHYSFVDSTLPFIWLPLDACEKFEEAFGLTWDEETELYLMNDTVHAAFVKLNPSITFTIGIGPTGGDTVDIVFPYNSFDLTATAPFVSNQTQYFPLKRAANDTQYTLGRAFLQEAMLVVDYERGNFSLTPCVWVSGAKSSIVTIASLADAAKAATSSTASSTASSTSTSGAGDGTSKDTTTKTTISTGTIAAISIAGVLALLLGAIIFYLRKNKKWPFATKAVEIGDSANASDDVLPPGTLTDSAEPSYVTTEPKGGTVEAMSYPLIEMGGHTIAEYYGNDPRKSPAHNAHEMADSDPVGSELASSHEVQVHEMFDDSIYRELHSTPSTQARSTPTRSVPTAGGNGNAQPFSWLETPISAVSGPVLPAYEGNSRMGSVSEGGHTFGNPSPALSRGASTTETYDGREYEGEKGHYDAGNKI